MEDTQDDGTQWLVIHIFTRVSTPPHPYSHHIHTHTSACILLHLYCFIRQRFGISIHIHNDTTLEAHLTELLLMQEECAVAISGKRIQIWRPVTGPCGSHVCQVHTQCCYEQGTQNAWG